MSISRRQFLAQTATAGAGAAGIGALALASGCATHPKDRRPHREVMTVLGPISPRDMGATLPHEHVMLDFIGADQVSRDRYDRDKVLAVVRPYLAALSDFGCRTVVECTPAYIGRDPILLKQLASETGLQILTNTGLYGAGQNKFLPDFARIKPADDLADLWLREWRHGIEDSGVRPGFIKIGVDEGPLSNLHRELVRAACRTHLDSGLTIAAHTGDGRAALEEISILMDEGVSGTGLIWVHAQKEQDQSLHWRAAELGAWVEFDHISPTDLAEHVQLVVAMKERGYLGRVLVSQDAGWYHIGEPNGGDFRSYETLFTEFIPELRRQGFTEEETSLLLVANPRDAFTIRVRRA
jgi:phosphotriesterase-related protein